MRYPSPPQLGLVVQRLRRRTCEQKHVVHHLELETEPSPLQNYAYGTVGDFIFRLNLSFKL